MRGWTVVSTSFEGPSAKPVVATAQISEANAQDAAIFMFTKLSRCCLKEASPTPRAAGSPTDSLSHAPWVARRSVTWQLKVRKGTARPAFGVLYLPVPIVDSYAKAGVARLHTIRPGVGFSAHPRVRPSTVLSNTSASSPFGAIALPAGTRVTPVRAAFAPNFGRSLSSVGSRSSRGPARRCAGNQQIAAESRQRPRPARSAPGDVAIEKLCAADSDLQVGQPRPGDATNFADHLTLMRFHSTLSPLSNIIHSAVELT